jgi:ribosomal subunit interface protein
MELPLQITFHNLERSDAVEANVRSRVGNLERFCDSIIGCRVTVESRHHHHARGRHFLIRIEVTVPGNTLVADRHPEGHHSYTDLYVAIRDTFDAMRRQLEDFERRRQGQAKAYDAPAA